MKLLTVCVTAAVLCAGLAAPIVPTDEEVAGGLMVALFNAADSHGDGRLSLKDFSKIMAATYGHPVTKEVASSVFNSIDTAGKGSIDSAQFAKYMDYYLAVSFSSLDTNKDGVLSSADVRSFEANILHQVPHDQGSEDLSVDQFKTHELRTLLSKLMSAQTTAEPTTTTNNKNVNNNNVNNNNNRRVWRSASQPHDTLDKRVRAQRLEEDEEDDDDDDDDHGDGDEEGGGGGGGGGGEDVDEQQQPPHHGGPRQARELQGVMEKLFQAIDLNGDGEISLTEMEFLMAVLYGTNARVTPQTVQQVFKQVDKDGNGSIDLEELTVFVRSVFGAIFRHWDANKDNKITREDIERVSGLKGKHLEAMVNYVMLADSNGDAEVTFDEYLGYWLQLLLKSIQGPAMLMMRMQQLFTALDTTKNDRLDKNELRMMSQLLDPPQTLTDEQATTIFARIDPLGTGLIDFNQFAVFVHSYLADPQTGFFAMMDQDKDGFISREDALAFYTRIDAATADDAVERLMRADTDSDDKISLVEFEVFMVKLMLDNHKNRNIGAWERTSNGKTSARVPLVTKHKTRNSRFAHQSLLADVQDAWEDVKKTVTAARSPKHRLRSRPPAAILGKPKDAIPDGMRQRTKGQIAHKNNQVSDVDASEASGVAGVDEVSENDNQEASED